MPATPNMIANVKAVNSCHAECNRLFPILAELFRPFVGQKIEKVDGTLLAKINSKLDFLPNTVPISVCRSRLNYSLAWTVRACESIPEDCGCLYYSRTIYVGDVSNGVLEKISPFEPAKTDYTTDELLKNLETYKTAKAAMEDARSALWPFSENIR